MRILQKIFIRFVSWLQIDENIELFEKHHTTRQTRKIARGKNARNTKEKAPTTTSSQEDVYPKSMGNAVITNSNHDWEEVCSLIQTLDNNKELDQEEVGSCLCVCVVRFCLSHFVFLIRLRMLNLFLTTKNLHLTMMKQRK